MKNKLNILLFVAVLVASVNMVSCSKDDDLGPTIFDTKEYPLDKNSYTFPLDTFVKVNFLEPYNMQFIYRMQYISSDKDKNLTPASYDNSCKLAVLTKYLWYDVYNDVAESHATFLKLYSPRIIHVIGSKSLNTSSGTETLGVTEGGTKVTLYRVNLINPNDIDDMNEYFFETMHHEFGHILDNNKLHPTTFNLLSNGHYNAAGWSDMPDSVAVSQGFFSNYASSSYTEDWVETLGRYITRDSITLEKMKGTAQYEWEIIDLEDKNGDGEKDEKDYAYMTSGKVDIDTIGYIKLDDSGNGEHKIYRRVCERDNNDYVVKGDDGKPKWAANTLGANQILQQKVEYVRNYMQTQFGINLDKLRYQIQAKQYRKDSNGQFITTTFYNPVTKRDDKRLENAIVYADPATGKTVLEKLLSELDEYKKLQNK
jgi:substrate import-associated zinc metallohydrolase lipoprotein